MSDYILYKLLPLFRLDLSLRDEICAKKCKILFKAEMNFVLCVGCHGRSSQKVIKKKFPKQQQRQNLVQGPDVTFMENDGSKFK